MPGILSHASYNQSQTCHQQKPRTSKIALEMTLRTPQMPPRAPNMSPRVPTWPPRPSTWACRRSLAGPRIRQKALRKPMRTPLFRHQTLKTADTTSKMAPKRAPRAPKMASKTSALAFQASNMASKLYKNIVTYDMKCTSPSCRVF